MSLFTEAVFRERDDFIYLQANAIPREAVSRAVETSRELLASNPLTLTFAEFSGEFIAPGLM